MLVSVLFNNEEQATSIHLPIIEVIGMAEERRGIFGEGIVTLASS